jgi:uncharacterized protein YecT (DUF1311 family)
MISFAVLATVTALAAPPPPKCPGDNTIEINDCMSATLTKAQGDLDRYLAAARTRLKSEAKDDTGAAAALVDLDKVQAAWVAYSRADCAAVYDYWSAGTIRDSMELTCEIDLTRRRTHTVWSEWLTYMDSTPPILPEPSTAPAP